MFRRMSGRGKRQMESYRQNGGGYWYVVVSVEFRRVAHDITRSHWLYARLHKTPQSLSHPSHLLEGAESMSCTNLPFSMMVSPHVIKIPLYSEENPRGCRATGADILSGGSSYDDCIIS